MKYWVKTSLLYNHVNGSLATISRLHKFQCLISLSACYSFLMEMFPQQIYSDYPHDVYYTAVLLCQTHLPCALFFIFNIYINPYPLPPLWVCPRPWELSAGGDGGWRPEHEKHMIGQEAGPTLTRLAVSLWAVSRVPSLFQRASVSSWVGLAVLEMHTRSSCLFWSLWLGLSESRQKTLYGSREWINKLFLELSQKDIK